MSKYGSVADFRGSATGGYLNDGISAAPPAPPSPPIAVGTQSGLITADLTTLIFDDSLAPQNITNPAAGVAYVQFLPSGGTPTEAANVIRSATATTGAAQAVGSTCQINETFKGGLRVYRMFFTLIYGGNGLASWQFDPGVSPNQFGIFSQIVPVGGSALSPHTFSIDTAGRIDISGAGATGTYYCDASLALADP